MVDDVTSFRELGYSLPIGDRAQLRARAGLLQLVPEQAGLVVQHVDLVPLVQQTPDKVASGEPGSAGHKSSHVVHVSVEVEYGRDGCPRHAICPGPGTGAPTGPV